MFQMLMPYQYIHEEDLFTLLSFGAPWSFAADGSAIKITINVCHIDTLVYFLTNLQRKQSTEILIIPFQMFQNVCLVWILRIQNVEKYDLCYQHILAYAKV